MITVIYNVAKSNAILIKSMKTFFKNFEVFLESSKLQRIEGLYYNLQNEIVGYCLRWTFFFIICFNRSNKS